MRLVPLRSEYAGHDPVPYPPHPLTLFMF